MTDPPPGTRQAAEAFALARRLLRGAGFIDRDTICPPRLRRDLHAPTPAEAQAYAGGPDRMVVVVTRLLHDAAAREDALAGLANDAWGYDVNILGTAPEIMQLDELRLWLLDDAAGLADRLVALGFAPAAGGFARGGAEARFPDLPAGFAAPVFPVWTSVPGSAPFAHPARRVLGYACPTPPPGALLEGTVRGFRLVQGGVPFRSLDRLRVVLPVVVGGAATGQRLRDAVALAHVLRETFAP
ncbi:hypothetical protein [Roseomonas sp. CECT 9278]|uniref:hypothetical protein n=1 Tax=Roseomonas sp. CECT 9278 TaxID=2845823 RepID=UPI001E6370DE|nr:hypothetical protein [Roseomonas sp. CECT 9278]CAH0287148.1 hypothetical protein ROS9278_04119 [Roseomonas sp. CECT 9278]